jgi:flagellar motor switch/type III secretory pathway protein FliN
MLSAGEAPSLEALGEIEVTVCARLGFARVPLATAAMFAQGSVVSLECAADTPVTLLVNGVAIASGELVLTEDGVLAVEIAKVPA